MTDQGWPTDWDAAVDGTIFAPHESLTIKIDPDLYQQISQQVADGDIRKHIMSLIHADLEDPFQDQ